MPNIDRYLDSFALVDPARYCPELVAMTQRATIDYVVSTLVNAFVSSARLPLDDIERVDAESLKVLVHRRISEFNITAAEIVVVVEYITRASCCVCEEWSYGAGNLFVSALILANKGTKLLQYASHCWEMATGYDATTLANMENKLRELLDDDLSITEQGLLAHIDNILRPHMRILGECPECILCESLERVKSQIATCSAPSTAARPLPAIPESPGMVFLMPSGSLVEPIYSAQDVTERDWLPAELACEPSHIVLARYLSPSQSNLRLYTVSSCSPTSLEPPPVTRTGEIYGTADVPAGYLVYPPLSQRLLFPPSSPRSLVPEFYGPDGTLGCSPSSSCSQSPSYSPSPSPPFTPPPSAGCILFEEHDSPTLRPMFGEHDAPVLLQSMFSQTASPMKLAYHIFETVEVEQASSPEVAWFSTLPPVSMTSSWCHSPRH